MSTRLKLALILGAVLTGACGSLAISAEPFYGDFPDRREAAPYRTLTSDEQEQFDLGVAVFNTQWVVANAPRAQRRDGLGPVFNAASCDSCHNNGARAQAPTHSGALTTGLVVQLAGRAETRFNYGHVLNTSAIEGSVPEGQVRVRYEERTGTYADGESWSLRMPRYEIHRLSHGRLDPDTVIKPRLAPALFGIGLLDAVPRGPDGRFGWQADSPSLADQTASALSREMGLSSSLIPHDDCGTRVQVCLDSAAGGTPEVSTEFMQALLSFQRWLAVPRPREDAATVAPGARLFESAGCAQCHLPELPVEGIESLHTIRAFTDLRVHDMGVDLADRNAQGNPVTSLWRTAPLWGLGHRNRAGRIDSLLHDGRARSIEEAILWHGGEAVVARRRFQEFNFGERSALVRWLELH